MIKLLRDILYYREQATYRFRQLVTQSVHTRWHRSEHLWRWYNDMLAHSPCAAEINAVPPSTLVTGPEYCGQLYHISQLAAKRRIRRWCGVVKVPLCTCVRDCLVRTLLF